MQVILGFLGKSKIHKKHIEASVRKYFGEKKLEHRSTKWLKYKKGYYITELGDGVDVYLFSQVTKLIDIGDSCFIAYTNEYAASTGFAGDEHGTMKEWKLDPECVPDLRFKMRAVIKKVTEKNRSRYILVEYLRIDK